jgi:ribonuclease III
MQSFNGLLDSCAAIEEKLGYQFKKKALLGLAFIHRSFFNEHRDEVPEHNERLEFLGDSVLGLLISDYLYEYLPSRPEGDLSHLRSHLVEAGACAAYLQKLGIAEYVLLGKGEKMNPGKGKESILADLFEALIGAIYLDGGLEACKQFFFRHFLDDVEALLQTPSRNWKAELQDYSQKKHQRPPFYKVMKEAGPDHSKVFHVSVFIEEEEMGQGFGSSKKQAEQMAAEQAVQRLGL